MKKFAADFFNYDHFIKTKTVYNFLDQDMSQAMHVCYNVNDPFIPQMGVSLISVLNNNPDQPLVFHIFTDGYSEENALRIQETAQKFHCCCILYVLNMEPFQDFHIKVQRFSRITYARLYMPKVLKNETTRFIYADADTMCIRSLKELWNLDMRGKALGCVAEKPNDIAYRAGYLKLKSGKYFNDGIMLVDIPAWEEQQITERCFAYQCEPPKRFLGQSQDVLNLVFDGSNYFLPQKYNVYGGGEFDTGDSVFIHWTGRRKPWQMVMNHFDQQWREYNALSPWPTITNILPVKKPENYHDFQQWGRYRKAQGKYLDYVKGIFWYAWLKLCYKTNCKKKVA